MSKNLSLREIERVLCEFYETTPELLTKRIRKREVVMLRQQAHCFSVMFVDTSLQKIGDYFGGHNHATVLYSCKVVENLCDTDKAYSDNIVKLTERFNLMNAGGVVITIEEIRATILKNYNSLFLNKIRELNKIKSKLKELSYD